MWLGWLQKDLIDILYRDNRNEVRTALTSALGSVPVSQNLELIMPSEIITNPPKINIRPRKPWKK